MATLTEEPISLAEAKRLATETTRCCCAPRAMRTSRHRSAPSSRSTTARPPTCSSPLRAASAWAVIPSWASCLAASSKFVTARPSRAPDRWASSTRPTLSPRSPLRQILCDALRALHAAAQRRALPDLPRFVGGAVGMLAYDAVSAPSSPPFLAIRHDPVGAPLAAFLETDLVIVFDHLTHTLSAIAALHTDAPDFDARYAVAERAVLEALERTARRRRGPRLSGHGTIRTADATDGNLPREAYIAASSGERGDRRRARPSRSCSLAGRPSTRTNHWHRPLPRASSSQPKPVSLLRPDA